MKRTVLLVFFALMSTAMAQEIDCTVTLNADAMNPSDRVDIQNLGTAIQNYINSYRWTGEEFKGPKIKVTLTIYLMSISTPTSTTGKVYTAQAFVASQRPIYRSTNVSPMVRVIDNSWQFVYQKDQPMRHDEFHFDPMAGFIDYYMFVVLGFDYDSYDPLGGSKFFQRASNIVAQAQNSDYSQGWTPGGSGTYSRYAVVNDALSGQYETFRKAFYDYEYNGIDLLSTQKDSAQATVARALDKMADLVIQSGTRSAFVKAFFDAKYLEIADALKDYPDKAILQKLSIADQAHQSTYSKYLN
ncbi:MAG TPA: DUF4835 family protein [Candidatus Acidoferrales bacterium]|nr:DUF4835 family protein [Candidatus Acidoferrales bacterium]